MITLNLGGKDFKFKILTFEEDFPSTLHEEGSTAELEWECLDESLEALLTEFEEVLVDKIDMLIYKALIHKKEEEQYDSGDYFHDSDY